MCTAFNNNNTNLSLGIISIRIRLKGAGDKILKKQENGPISYPKVTRVKVSQEIQNFLLKESQGH